MRFCFYLGYKDLKGGYSTLMLTLIKEFHRQHYEVVLINFSDGLIAKELKKVQQIVRLNYTTGNYSMFAEIVCKDIQELRFVLHDELQKIKGIERTETFISLEESLDRNVVVAPKQ